ncbi:hypothetical protein, partial [Pedobacter sp.]|uniref:hypothetical protein n=1 Tax=Pedobacter sp. TaxID=1411316 RepID=UPI003C500CD2
SNLFNKQFCSKNQGYKVGRGNIPVMVGRFILPTFLFFGLLFLSINQLIINILIVIVMHYDYL